MEKLNVLVNKLKNYKKVAVAFSGGVDSSLLLKAAKIALGKENVFAITAKGVMIAEENYKEAIELAKKESIHCITVEIGNFKTKEFKLNQKNRCYACKKAIFEEMLKVSYNYNCDACLEGSNLDDEQKYRPGRKAMEELGIISPLKDALFTKKDVREAAKQLGIVVWDRPSDSCLATRFPYNTTLTKELFYQAEQAEKIIKELGIKVCRVRIHGEIARIEVEKKDVIKLMEETEVVLKIKQLGIKYITVDLEGFRSGSLDE